MKLLDQSEYLQKLLTNNHTVSLHRHHPKKTRQYLQLLKTPKHPHEFLSKITHTLLKERLSEPLELVQRQAPLSEPTYNLYPTLPQELSRIRNISQNQNTVEINRQIIHPRRNRNFQTSRVHFDISQSPSPITPENPNSILPETPTLLSQRTTSSIPSDYFGSTPTSEKIRDNPFNPPNQTSRLPYWTTHSFTQSEPNLINDPIDISTDTTTSSSLPETLSLPSTPSISQISPTPFHLNFPNNLDIENNHQQMSL